MQVLSDFWVAEFFYSEYNDLKKNVKLPYFDILSYKTMK